MYIDVGDGHRIYYEVHGNLNARPAVVIHGGPGGGMQRSVLKLFDLKRWRVLLFDQRGCGKSTPFLSLHRNTTWDLVTDIERLRKTLDVESWTVFGGSWGSTLALAYASKHQECVDALVLRGIYLGSSSENDWLYRAGGASQLRPVEWSAFVKGSKTKKIRGNESLIPAYSRLLRNSRTRKVAAKAWSGWESAISTLEPSPDKSSTKLLESIAVLEAHYFSHNSWLRPGQLLRAARKIPSSIPVIIVQGSYDLVCPPAAAVALAGAVKHSELHMTHAGHATSEPETSAALKKALLRLDYARVV
jgi:proline iminopeptidase